MSNLESVKRENNTNSTFQKNNLNFEKNGKRLNTIDTGHEDMIHGAGRDYYGLRLATCSSDNSVQTFELNDGQTLTSCSYDRKVIIWKEIGKYVNHKGRSRHFTSPEELEEERKNKEKKKYREKEGGSDVEDSDEDSSDENVKKSGSEDSSEDDDSDDNKKSKGVSGLIEIENPNRIQKKSAEKVTKINVGAGSSSSTKPELTRREREEIEKQRARAHYQKLHAEGKTEQARADLARLAIIKQHRAEAAARREAEKKEKDDQSKKATK